MKEMLSVNRSSIHRSYCCHYILRNWSTRGRGKCAGWKCPRGDAGRNVWGKCLDTRWYFIWAQRPNMHRAPCN